MKYDFSKTIFITEGEFDAASIVEVGFQAYSIGKGAGGEIQLTDGIAALMKDETVLAYRYDGRRFDCGSKLGYLQASVEIGLQHPETGAAFSDWLREQRHAG
jgi:UTP--glucose-1-phosphate uridylyltransferase